MSAPSILPQSPPLNLSRPKVLSGIPNHRSSDFQIPDWTVNAIEKALVKRSIAVIHGSELSKSIAAQKFIRKHQHKYRGIVWIDTSSESAIYLATSRFFKDVHTSNRRGFKSLVHSINRIYDKKSGWLMVLDHYNSAIESLDWKNFVGRNRLEGGGHFIHLIDDPNMPNDVDIDSLKGDYIYGMFKACFGKEPSNEEKATLDAIHLTLGRSPAFMRLALRYIHIQNPTLSLEDYHASIQPPKDADTASAWKASMKKAFDLSMDQLKNEKDAFSLMNTWRYFQSENLPISVIISLFRSHKNPAESAYKALETLSKHGLIDLGTQLKKSDFKPENQANLKFSIDQKFQFLLGDRQSEQKKELPFFLKGLNAVMESFPVTRENYDLDVGSLELKEIAVHLEKILKARDAFPKNGEVLKCVADGFTRLGRFYQANEIFDLAIRNHTLALETLKRYRQLLKRTSVGSLEVKIETLHNLGSSYLRIWENLSPQEREKAVDILKRTVKAAQMRVQLLSGKGDDDQLYKAKHFALYSIRALARGLKKNRQYHQVRHLLEQIHAIPEYVTWPNDKPTSETLPLSHMDLGVIYRLITKSQRNNGKENTTPHMLDLDLSVLGIDSQKQVEKPVDLQQALVHLEKSVRLYEAKEYQFKNKDYDLGIALIRLGEAYLDATDTSTAHVPSDLDLTRAQFCFLRAIDLIASHFDEEPSLNQGRANYRLAEVYFRLNNIPLAIEYIEEAICIQEMFLEKDHAYLTASRRLMQQILAKQKNKPHIDPFKLPTQVELPEKGTHKHKGVDYFLKGELADAAYHFLKHLKKDPEDSVSRILLGHCCLEEGFYEKAVYYYKTGLVTLMITPLPKMTPEIFELSVQLDKALAYATSKIKAKPDSKQSQHATANTIPLKFAIFSKGLEEKVAIHLATLFHSKKALKNSPYLRQFLRVFSALSNAKVEKDNILHILAAQMEQENIPADLFLEDMTVDVARSTFNGLSALVQNMMWAFEDQIERLSLQSINRFIEECARRIVEVIKARENLESLETGFWKNFLNIKKRKTKLLLRTGQTCKFDSFVRQCGLRTDDKQYFVLKEGNRSSDYGFRLVSTHEINDTLYEQIEESEASVLFPARRELSNKLWEDEDDDDNCLIM